MNDPVGGAAHQWCRNQRKLVARYRKSVPVSPRG